jgi:hypothetical protein
MPEWSTYSPENFLMFSARTYYRLFERHNTALWPGHVVALLAGAAVFALLWRRPDARTARLAVGVLAAGWLVVAVAYFWVRYSTIHTGGKWFAAAFGAQALALAWCGIVGRRLELAVRPAAIGRTGLGLIAFSVLLYPLVGRLLGRPWMQAEVFGLAPDPTVLATLGLLLAAKHPAWWLWIVPVGWSLFSAMTLWALHAPEALGMGMVPVVWVVLAFRCGRAGVVV